MTFVVPFDGSDLAEAALARAVEFRSVRNARVVALTAIPRGNRRYAAERGWLDERDSFDLGRVADALEARVSRLAPEADFDHVLVGRHAPPGTIASHLRKRARSLDASVVFVGSENAGRLVSTMASIGASVVAEDEYDVVIVREES